jgi:hypothetical protein
MTNEAVTVAANIARAMIQAMGMQAENKIREHRGEYPAYCECDFLRVIDAEGIGYNEIRRGLYGS